MTNLKLLLILQKQVKAQKNQIIFVNFFILSFLNIIGQNLVIPRRKYQVLSDNNIHFR